MAVSSHRAALNDASTGQKRKDSQQPSVTLACDSCSTEVPCGHSIRLEVDLGIVYHVDEVTRLL
jgi:hypothetical protein